MTPQDEFNIIAEARLAKMAAENLEKRFEEWTNQHDRNADERHADLKGSIKDLSNNFDAFCNRCLGPTHAQQIFRLMVWCSILSGLVALLLSLHGIHLDLTKLFG